MKDIRIRKGRRHPPGATPFQDGVNFCIFSRHATRVELLLFEDHASPHPFAVVELDPEENRDFFFWSVFIEGLKPGAAYAWRMDGPRDISQGFRFDPRIELLDPWARQVSDILWDRPRAKQDPRAPRIRGIVPRDEPFDWGADGLLDMPPERAIIYELHVGGFTKHPSSGVEHPGTFLGLKEKIPYLKDLGITHVELLPIMAFDTQDVPEPVRRLGLTNFWGYSPHSFFALHPGYLVDPWNPGCRNEFKELVRALHEAGIGVILDVVFNHTTEGGDDGPVINFKGIGNRAFYFLDPEDPAKYLDFTGCGNTIKCNHPLVAFFIINCLEYWVEEFHVDGFRFDLASVLARGEDTRPMYHAPVIWSLEFSSRLEKAGLIAEAWDASGLYQVGAFPGYRWQEWNGRYRDVIRRFVRGDEGLLGETATRLAGSSDLYAATNRNPFNSINFITCHDGFTLWDLVSYERKHNEANGEENRDGSDQNFSCNYGVEGDTDDPEINGIRFRQARNFMALLMLSQGVPMLLAGDEILRSQKGNNNTWCQDNEIGWIKWQTGARAGEMLRFTRELTSFRTRHRSLMRRHFLTGRPCRPNGKECRAQDRDSGGSCSTGMPDITWHGKELGRPEWDDPKSRILGFTLAGVEKGEEHIHAIINMDPERDFEAKLPQLPGQGHWYRAVDTSLEPPDDIVRPEKQPVVDGFSYLVPARTIVVLEWR